MGQPVKSASHRPPEFDLVVQQAAGELRRALVRKRETFDALRQRHLSTAAHTSAAARHADAVRAVNEARAAFEDALLAGTE